MICMIQKPPREITQFYFWNTKIDRRPEKVIELDLIPLTVGIIMETNE